MEYQMEFTCSRLSLNEALSLVGSIVPSKSIKPILQNIKFEGTNNNMITLFATDLEIGIRYDLPVESIKNPGSVLLPANRLIGIIRESWGENIKIQIEDNKADIFTDGGKFHIIGEPADDFPTIASEETLGNEYSILAEDLMISIQRTIFAIAREEARYALAGVYIVLEDQQMEMVTTDTFRLAVSNKPLREKREGKRQAIVLAKGIQELMKVISNEEIVRIQLTETQCIAKTSNSTMVCRLIEGKFPNYKNIIPTEFSRTLKINREKFIQALRQAALLTNEESHAIQLETRENQLIIAAVTTDGTKADITIDAEIQGGNITITFNYMYLMDVCKVITEERITLKLNNEDTPARIDSNGYTYIVSPVCPRRDE